MNLDKKTSFAIGRRKQAIAQVQLEVGVGNFCINGRSADDYFQYNQNFLKQIGKALFLIFVKNTEFCSALIII